MSKKTKRAAKAARQPISSVGVSSTSTASSRTVKPRCRWNWLLASEYGGADADSMGKLFRNREALSDTALLGREAVQNSNDAAEALRRMLKCSVPFSVQFRYVNYEGEKRRQMIDDLGLRELRERHKITSHRLPPGSILEDLDDDSKPLRILYVEDFGSHGLFGHPREKNNSHLFLALYVLGGSKKEDGAGGSYGFGKSALQRASKISTVIAHSAFRPFKNDPVTRRLVGFTWWTSHQESSQWYEGRAMFAEQTQEDGPEAKVSFTPYEDSAADDVATALGITIRDPNVNEQLGTTFMIVDPSIQPKDLLFELEKWWWPALEDHLFDLKVIDEDGTELHPKPSENSFVAPFIPAYHLATGQAKVSDSKKQRVPSDKWRSLRNAGIFPGTLGLVVPDDEQAADESNSRPIVALMRGPRMVLQYKSYDRRRVPIRGAFVASSEANNLLRDTEPSDHQGWDSNPSNDVSPDATKLAKSVLEHISTAVKEMASDIVPPPPQSKRSLPFFSSLLGGFLTGKPTDPPPPPPGGEPIELHLPGGRIPHVVGPDELALQTTLTVRLLDKAPDDVALVQVSCSAIINEDEGNSGSRLPVKIAPQGSDHGFVEEEDGSWTGEISKTDRVKFDVETDSYSDLWTVTLTPAVKRMNPWGNS